MVIYQPIDRLTFYIVPSRAERIPDLARVDGLSLGPPVPLSPDPTASSNRKMPVCHACPHPEAVRREARRGCMSPVS